MRQVVPEYKGALHKELAVNAGRAPENAGDQNSSSRSRKVRSGAAFVWPNKSAAL